jgi:hypothetical protein
MKRFTYFILFIFFLAVQINLAQVPRLLNYQGVLTDASGTIVPDGNYNVTLRIYSVPTVGSPIWEEAQLVATTSGIFNAILGSIVPLNIPFDNQYWLGVTVGSGSELIPRVSITSSAYSLNSSNAEKVNNIEANSTPTANNLLPLNSAGIFPTSVVPQSKIDGVSGGSNVDITATTNTEIISLTISDAGTKDVFLSGEVVVEVGAIQNGKRYEFSIRKGSISGTMIGRGWCRLSTTITGLIAETISFSAIDKDVTGAATYYLVGRKYDSDAADALVFIYSLNSIYVLK